MAERGVHSASWFVIGFLAGVAATLAALIYAGGRSTRPDETAAAAPATRVSDHPRRFARLRHSITGPTTPAPSASSQPSAAPDEQVQEDAAATGMTSRAQPPAQSVN